MTFAPSPGHERQFWDAMEWAKGVLPEPIARINEIFCGCGEPESAWTWFLGYLGNLRSGSFCKPNSPVGWVAVYLADHLKLTEHGTTINCCWLTDDGIVALAFLERFGIDWADDSGPWIDRSGALRSSIESL